MTWSASRPNLGHRNRRDCNDSQQSQGHRVRYRSRQARMSSTRLAPTHRVASFSASSFGVQPCWRFSSVPEPCLIGMEACPGSQWLARELQSFGHKVRIIPAQFVKPYVKSNKNDTIDAAAIAEAVTRPTMRFVEVKQPAQVDIQALHRIRDQMVGHRTKLICQMRAFCLEYRLPIRQGVGAFKASLPPF